MDGEPPQEEDFSQIPIVERSQHKVFCQLPSPETQLTSRTGKPAYQPTTMLLRNQQKRLQTQIHSSAHSSRTVHYCESHL
jgi:hypothetical protein